jgi:hypothetical protein
MGDEERVATTERPGIPFGLPVRVYAPGTGPQPRSASVAIGAHELAGRDLGNNTLKSIGLAHEFADLHGLRTDVIELEDCGIRDAAIGACTGLQDLDDIRPRDCSAPVPRLPTLEPVKISTLPHVFLATVLAPTLPAMKMVRGQRSMAVVCNERSPADRSPAPPAEGAAVGPGCLRSRCSLTTGRRPARD